MITLQTYIVYTLLFLVMFFCAKLSSERKEWVWLCFAIFIYSVIFGMRYGVGVDHLAYLEDYQRATFALDNPNDDTEVGFKFIRNFFATRGFHYTIYFSIIAFLQLWLIFKVVKKSRSIYPYLVLTFFLGCIWLTYANGLRQQLAFCIFAYSLLFIEDKKTLPIHYALLFLALSMHNSAALLFFITPILLIKTNWFSNIKWQYILLFISITIGHMPQMEGWLMSLDGNLGVLEYYLEETRYNEYFEYDDGDTVFKEKGAVGIGYYVELFCNLMIIWFSNVVKRYNSNKKIVTYMYNFTFIGMCLHYAFIASPIISRINYYFYGFSFILGAFTLHYLYNNNKKAFYILLGLYLLTFIGTLYRMHDNTSAFYFFWQNNLYGK